MYVHSVQACIQTFKIFRNNGFAFLSLIKYSVFITTDEFKLLNRANGVRGLRWFSLRPTEVKEASDETGETFQCCRGSLN